MFTELHEMAKAAMLLITATAEGDQLRISVTPTYPDGKVPTTAAALRPLSLVGTPGELNADFATALGMWQAPRRSILDQAQAQVDESNDDADDTPKATAKVTKASDAKPKIKTPRKSAPAAAPQGDDTDAQKVEIASAESEDVPDAPPVEAVGAEPVTAPAPALTAQADGAVDESVDVHTLDLF